MINDNNRTIMGRYIGVKLITCAILMTRLEYCKYRGWDLPDGENGDDPVYLVEYEADENNKPNHKDHEGYISMSPKDVFEKAYRPIDGLSFGLAIEALKQGKCIARKGWNGKGMFVFKQIKFNVPAEGVDLLVHLPANIKSIMTKRGQGLNSNNQMLIVKSDGSMDSWVASSSDTFAEDWIIVE